MTGREAFEQIEREAKDAGVPMNGEIRDVLIAELEADPAAIPSFLRAARLQIEARRPDGASPM